VAVVEQTLTTVITQVVVHKQVVEETGLTEHKQVMQCMEDMLEMEETQAVAVEVGLVEQVEHITQVIITVAVEDQDTY
jgi:hypothetical protein